MQERAEKQGIGRKTVNDVNKQACSDIQALSDFLGAKSFMHGHQMSLVSWAYLSVQCYFDVLLVLCYVCMVSTSL